MISFETGNTCSFKKTKISINEIIKVFQWVDISYSEKDPDSRDILVIKKEEGKFYEQDKELVSEFLFDQKSSISTTNYEGKMNQVETAKFVPFLWPHESENPGIRIYNEIKSYIEN